MYSRLFEDEPRLDNSTIQEGRKALTSYNEYLNRHEWMVSWVQLSKLRKILISFRIDAEILAAYKPDALHAAYFKKPTSLIATISATTEDSLSFRITWKDNSPPMLVECGSTSECYEIVNDIRGLLFYCV